MNNRRRLIGTVTSAKMPKTVSVEVTRTYQHPLYHKVVRGSKIYKAHDELNCHVGDKVRIVESAPLSRTKHWIVEEILKVEVREEDDLSQISEGEQA
ncbi:MAG TPA: 30S ribosomal protein S17 [Anaerolineaceae bacterium]|jgi:small subunit ribosomal protein S17|nr:30S ribosomal protein S17 [Anaerolineaceae bacterium]HRT92634.1 30S ribosomal protein S17 [Anaerolineaceae bacterium]HUM48629.1 30S ribosomal protein S17 [Anaerolineaceae bacterium]